MLSDFVVRVSEYLGRKRLIKVSQICQLKKLFPSLSVCAQQLLEMCPSWPYIFTLVLKVFHLSLDDAIAYFAYGWKVLVVLLEHDEYHSLFTLRKGGSPVLPPVEAEPLPINLGNHAIRGTSTTTQIIEAKRIMSPLAIGPFFDIISSPFDFDGLFSILEAIHGHLF